MMNKQKLATPQRASKSFSTKKEYRRYWGLLLLFTLLGILAAIGLLIYNNPVPVDSPSFVPVTKRRFVAVLAMFLAAICQGLSTVAFQSVTNNRIITPSILGFESLYSVIQTSMIFFFGANALISFKGVTAFFIQVFVMVVVSILLYGWLLSGKYANIQFMLLIGIVIGTGLGSLSSFMRKMLSPSEFDILQARLFGSVNNADAAYFPFVIPIVLVIAGLLLFSSKKLNILSLGKDVSMTLGMNYKANMIYMLILVSILMSVSTALIGPMTFFGFLVATLTYQAAPTYDHRYIFPMALAIGFLIMTGAYFIMYHVFHAQGVVSVIIELFGGVIFLIVVLRKRIL